MAGRKAATNETPEAERIDLDRVVFLMHLADAGLVGESAAAAGVSRATAYRWYSSDTEFALAWDAAIEASADLLEREARRRAVDGVEEPVIYQGQMTPIYERDECGEVVMREDQARNPDGSVLLKDGKPVACLRPVQARNPDGSLKWLTVRRPSDTLLQFLLKGRRPDVYRERFEHSGPGGKDLPAPVNGIQAGVLVVPGLINDPTAWTALVRANQPGQAPAEK